MSWPGNETDEGRSAEAGPDAASLAPGGSSVDDEKGAATDPVPMLGSLLAATVAVASAGLFLHYVLAKTALGSNPVGLFARLRDLVVFSLFLGAAWAAGARSLGWLGLHPRDRLRHSVLSLGAGFVYLYVAATFLVVAGMVNRWSLALVLIVPLLVGRHDLRRAVLALRSVSRPVVGISPFSLLTGSLVMLYGVMVLSPPNWIDATTYHLTLPKEYLAHGGLPDHAGNFFHSFPHAMSMLYLYLMGLGSDLLPKLLHGVFLAMIAGLCYAEIRDAVSKRVARYAVLLFAAEWCVQHGIQRANVDFHYSFYALAALFLVVRVALRSEPSDGGRWAVLAGLFLGAALAGKVHAVNAVLATELLLVVLVWRRLVDWRSVVSLNLVAGLTYLPMLIRNSLHSVDLYVFLLAERLGLELNVDHTVAFRLRELSEMRGVFLTEANPVTFLFAPIFVYFDGSFPTTTFDGFLNPFYLVTLIVGLAFVRRDRFLGLVYLYLFGFYVAWLVNSPLTRYALPILPLLCLITVVCFDRLSEPESSPRQPRRVFFFGLILATVAVNLLSMALEYRYFLGTNIAAFLEHVPRRSFIAQTHSRDTFALEGRLRILEEEHSDWGRPSRNGVFMVFASQTYYLDHPYLNDPFYTNLALLRAEAEEGRDPVDWLRSNGYGYVLADFARIPWLFRRSHDNPYLNPYPEALEALATRIAFWRETVEPRLQLVEREGRLTLFRVPAGTVDSGAGTPEPGVP